MKKNNKTFRKEKLSEKTKWFLTLSPSERHNMAVSMLAFVNENCFNRKHDKGLFKAIQIIKQK